MFVVFGCTRFSWSAPVNALRARSDLEIANGNRQKIGAPIELIYIQMVRCLNKTKWWQVSRFCLRFFFIWQSEGRQMWGEKTLSSWCDFWNFAHLKNKFHWHFFITINLFAIIMGRREKERQKSEGKRGRQASTPVRPSSTWVIVMYETCYRWR